MSRSGYVRSTTIAALGAGALAFVTPAPRLIWNATASAPTGLYALLLGGQLHPLDLVAARPPEAIAAYLADGGFLPKGVPLLKRVLAVSGQTICRTGDVVTVDQIEVGVAQSRDHLGGALPRWSGCRRLSADEIFLMNPTVPDSLDGRYFGPIPIASIIGRAVPLWTNAAGDGRFVWRAAVD